MPIQLTHPQRLAALLLDQSLSEYVAEKRNARPRWPWTLIAEQLTTDTNGEVVVSAEALRVWFRDEVAS